MTDMSVGRSARSRSRRLLYVLTLVVPLVLACSGSSMAATTTVNDSAATYSGSWSTCSDAQYFNSDCHYSNTVGNTVTYAFSGTFVRWIGATNSGHGKADVQICDGSGANCGAATVVDTNANTWSHQQVLYANYGLSGGSHTIKITVRSDTNGTDRYVDVDAFAFGTKLSGNFYINNQAGSGCSNSNAGTSSVAPWCDFTNLNGETFAAGSQILLAQGATWNQELGKLYGAGNSSNWITIDEYGSGARPKICRNRNAADRAIWLDNPDYWRLRNLEICDTGAGIVAYYTSNGHNGLRFENIYTHDNDVIHWLHPNFWSAQADLPGMYHGVAIFVTGQVPVTASDHAVSGIVYDGIESYHDSNPIDIAGFNPGVGGLNFLTTDLGHHAVGDVVVKNANFHDAAGAPNFDNVEHMKIISSRLVRMCTAQQLIGTTALFLWSDDDLTIVNSVLSDTPYTNSPDGTGTDLEAYESNINLRGNWIANNVGAGVEFLSLNRPGDYSTGHEVSSNAFFDNGLNARQRGSLLFVNGPPVVSMTGTARDNLTYEPIGFAVLDPGPISWTFSNNLDVTASGLFNAGNNFASTQGASNWGYQSYNGASWSDLSYDSANAWWGSSSGYVDRFNTLPSACSTCWMARTWTAPYTGTVSLRGRILKNDDGGGDGVLTRITKNGVKIWPTSGSTQAISSADQVGVDANLDAVSVAVGDVIRFEVNAGPNGARTNDLTSWSPSVGYTALSSPGPTIVEDTTTGSGDGQVNYASGTWSTSGSVHYNLGTTTTAVYTVKFTGAQVVVRGAKYSDRGIAAYSICDASGGNCGAETLVDQYAGSLQTDQVLWTSPLLVPGQYTLRVRTTNTKNGSSSGKIVDVDRIAVSANDTVVNDGTTGSGDGQVNYASGSWTVRDDVHFNDGATSTASYLVKFTGPQIVVHGARNGDRGIAGYSICDANGANCGAETLVDQYAGSLQTDQVLWTSPLLSTGQHTLKVRTTHTKNASASDYWVDLDKVVIN